MSFDVTEARKAVERVRERSAGPTALDDLAALLSGAITALGDAEQRAGTLGAQIDVVRTQAAGERTKAATLQAQATEARARVADDEAVLTDRLATLLEQLMFRLDALETANLGLQVTLDEVAAQAAESARESTIALEATRTLQGEAEARVGRYRGLLERIAAMPWYTAVRSASQAANEGLNEPVSE